MRLIIAGGRDYKCSDVDYLWLDSIADEYNVTLVISGGAKGADKCGEEWAKSRNIKVVVFEAEWDMYGKMAGPLRNEQMAIRADAVALFPGGRGTASMEKIAKIHNLMVLKRPNQIYGR